jgi:hypothetical protein
MGGSLGPFLHLNHPWALSVRLSITYAVLVSSSVENSVVPILPKGRGNCAGPEQCANCIAKVCPNVWQHCGEDHACRGQASCINSTIAAWHISNTPNSCQSMECITPCFGTDPAVSAEAGMLLECAAMCLPETLVGPLSLLPPTLRRP